MLCVNNEDLSLESGPTPMTKPKEHFLKTKRLATKLDPSVIFEWLSTEGYFPESYILPPTFFVSLHPKYGRKYATIRAKKYTAPSPEPLCELHFPKTDLTDRTFGIIHPEIHSEICFEIAKNWKEIIKCVFNPKNLVYSYGFPVPLNSDTPGAIGRLRAGRMIYEWIEMAESDLLEEAFAYKYIVKTDIKNFYPSIYTHSIAWALHTRKVIRNGGNRYDCVAFLGNRLDKLFQSANDGCTNGLPIGPAVSDLVSEIILSAVDTQLSQNLPGLKRGSILALRFKDDYRFLCKEKDDCRKVTKALQNQLKKFNLLLNENKTLILELPDGIFREWTSRYHAIQPRKNKRMDFKEFKEFYLNVLRIDKELPGTGIIDRFIKDITDGKYRPLFDLSDSQNRKVISLLVLMAERRVRSFPKILGVIEGMLIKAPILSPIIEQHLNKLLATYSKYPDDNRYLISWILYFLSSNNLKINKPHSFSDPILNSLQSNCCKVFLSAKDFTLFRTANDARLKGVLLQHLDVFKR